MGMSLEVTLTPYIRIVEMKRHAVTTVKRHCASHPKVKIYQDEQFCRFCGSKIVNEEYTESVALDPEEVFESESLSPNQLITIDDLDGILIPNNRSPEEFNVFSLDTDSENAAVNLNGDGELIRKHISWFTNKYKKHIEALLNAYGDDNVQICWGLVHYWN